MPEVYRLCDTVSVLRDGAHVGDVPTASIGEAELVQLMIGRPLSEYFPRSSLERSSDEVLRAERLSVPGQFQDISFGVRAGEVVGLAGLVGAGRSEVAKALFGLEPTSRGDVIVRGKRTHLHVAARCHSAGIGTRARGSQAPGHRRSESSLHNTSLPVLRRVSVLGWILRRKELERVTMSCIASMCAAPRASTRRRRSPAGTSRRWSSRGGWRRSAILILDEPTRGVDVGAKAEIHALIGELAGRGTAVPPHLERTAGSARTSSIASSCCAKGESWAKSSARNASQETLLRLMAGLSVAPG